MFGRPRLRGEPASSNGASSLHLRWLVDGPVEAVRVTVEVLRPPVVDRLYFWALQASFSDRGRRLGGAHLGMQHHPAHPGDAAVNFGGYAATGGQLRGTESALPSARDNPNTRDYLWHPGRPYRLAILPTDEPGTWAGTVTDVVADVTTEVRRLLPGGTELIDPMVWSEVFARCEHPSASVRWSRPEIRTGGSWRAVEAASVNYQTKADGGCDNTNAEVDEAGIVQRTNAGRATRRGAVLRWPPTT